MQRPWLAIKRSPSLLYYASLPDSLTRGLTPRIFPLHKSSVARIRPYARHVRPNGAIAASIGHAKTRQTTIQAVPDASDRTHQIKDEPDCGTETIRLPSDIAAVDAYIIQQLRRLIHPTRAMKEHKDGNTPTRAPTSLTTLLAEFDANTSRILDSTLSGESVPRPGRRLDFDSVQTNGQIGRQNDPSDLHDNPVVLVAHITLNDEENAHKIALCSGFFIEAQVNAGGPILVSCAHTLEEMRHNKLHEQPTSRSASLVFTQAGHIYSISSVLSALPLSDVALFSIRTHAQSDVTQVPSNDPDTALSHLQAAAPSPQTLPVNPYPAPEGTPARVHLVSFQDPGLTPEAVSSRPTTGAASLSNSEPFMNPTMWKHLSGDDNGPESVVSEWVEADILGYRDRAGREVHPGTYDTLAHILYKPVPTSGSSGAPILDAETGAVIGIVTGAAFLNRVEGRRGFGTPAEVLFEMFSLPGIHSK